MSKRREQTRLRARPESLSRPLPSVPESIRKLRSSNNGLYVHKLVCFLRARATNCHPSSDVGWWCRYEEEMRDLVTFLSEPDAGLRHLWHSFRDEVARQLSLCRQCAVAYHKAVKEWEVSNEVSKWPNEVIRKRVNNLVEWDALRLTPMLEKGAKCPLSTDDTNGIASRTQCREAFFDATLSLRLCMDTAFCTVLDKIFRAEFAVPTNEDFKRFVRESGAIPRGLAALCFHRYDEVRFWAKSLYATSPRHLQVDDQALELLMSKSLRLAVDNLETAEENIRSRRTVWAPDLQSIWDGVNVLVRRMSSDSLRSIMKRSKRFPLVSAVYKFLKVAGRGESMHGAPPGFSQALRFLQCVLLVAPLPSLLGCRDLTLKMFLDVVAECFKIRSLRQQDRLLLVDTAMDITSSSMKWNNTFDTRAIFFRCVGLLEYLTRPEWIHAHRTPRDNTTRTDRESDSCADILAKGARLVVRFYWHFWPQLPLDDQNRLAQLITTVVRAIPDSDCAWELLRNALLTDVCSLLLCIYKPQEVENVFKKFFSSSTEMGEEENKKVISVQEGVVKMLVVRRGASQRSLPWVDELWRNVTAGAHVSGESRHSKKVRDFDVRLALDLHRLVGVLDPQRCATLVKGVMHDSSPDGMSAGVTGRLVSQRVETIFEAILSRLQLSRQISAADISSQDMSLHAAHLLTSSYRKISKDAHLALLTKCQIHNAMFARIQSRDKLLVHVLKHNEKDRLMVYEGFMSVSRMISAQSRAISAQTYTSFFRWYALLASRDCRILWDTNILQGAFIVLLNFLETLENFEAAMTSEAFQETVCRMFSTIPLIWKSFNDYEKSASEDGPDESRRFAGEVLPLVQKVGMRLLTSCTIRDKLALDAWVRMVTQDTIRSALIGMKASRSALLGILGKNVRDRSPLDFEQCRRLSDAYSLEEASVFLDEWAPNGAGRPSRQRLSTLTMKPYREERIDGCSSVIADKDNRVGRRTAKKHSILSVPATSARHNGHLNDLRRDHRQERADLRRATAKYGSVSGRFKPVKTRFELIREERIAQKQKEKLEAHHDVSMVHRLGAHSEDSNKRDCSEDSQNDSTERLSHVRSPLEKTKSQSVCYPHSRRNIRTRSMEQVKRALLIPGDPVCLGKELYTGVSPRTFSDVESYISYWEPLLIAECRAAIRRRTEEEQFLVTREGKGTRDLGSERIFVVDGPVEDVGYLHTLSISCHNRYVESSLDVSDIRGTKPFDMSREQASDVLLLEISEARQIPPKGQNGKPEIVTAIVSNTARTKKKTQLSLHLVLDATAAPSKGRKLRVRKLLSLTTLHRQLDALWALPKAQDGILWSLMDPANAWRIKRDLEAREDHRVDRNSSLPMRIVEKVEKLGLLNSSQCKAVADVIRSCHCLFARPYQSEESQHRNDNKSGVSLIQGPPGTGKTSTIITLLSALLVGNGSQPYVRKARVIEGGSAMLSIPAIRILVCAPSNAAVDEIMTRVMDEGLITLSDYQVCPRIVRVGHGTTVRALQALEVHSMARTVKKETVVLEASTSLNSSEDHQKLLEVNNQIEKLEVDRRSTSVQADAESDRKGSLSHVSHLSSEKLNDINQKLDILHAKKRHLLSTLKQERATRKMEDKVRRQEDMRAVLETLAAASVVFATLSSAGHEDLKSLGERFDVVIIDEAGQSCEPETLIPMTIGQYRGSMEHRFMHTVLVGDPKQLPPTVISPNHHVADPLSRSLFERIALVDPSAVHLLDTQYRMHPKISSFPCSRFYNGLLRNSSKVKDKTMHRIWHFDAEKRFGPLTLFDMANTSAKEARNHSGSLSNDTEARFVIQGILSMLRLYQREHLAQSIAVLSPYKQQVQLLKRLIAQNDELKDANIEANTIDGIQGREKSVVVLSTVRSGHSRDIGFVKDDRRLNVALTRAKHSLLIFGNASFLSKHSESWAALVSHCRERSQIISLSSARNNTFRESQGVFRFRRPHALPETDKLPDIEDENTGGTVLALNVTSGAEIIRYEGVNDPEEKVMTSGDAVGKTSTPNTQAMKKSVGTTTHVGGGKSYAKDTHLHHDGLRRQSVHYKPGIFRSVIEHNDASSPRSEHSQDDLTTDHSSGKSVSPAEKRQKVSKSPTVLTKAVKQNVVEKADVKFSTESRFEQSNLLASKRGRNVSQSRADNFGSSGSIYRRLQDESAQRDSQFRASRRLPGRIMGAGGRSKDQQHSRAIVPAKRARSSSDFEPLYNSAPIPKRARAQTSAKVDFSHRRTHSIPSQREQRMSATLHAKRRIQNHSIPSQREQRTSATLHEKRRIVQKSASFQNRRQINQRPLQLRRTNHDRKDGRDRPFPNAAHAAQAQRKKAVPTFSLADTSAKLKRTLEAAQKARQ